jgi:hypothetical protein
MFYTIISKLPIIEGEYRNLIIFIVGTILYIIAHAYLFSKQSESNELFVKYRDYLYYMFGLDCLIFYATLKKSDSDKPNQQNISDKTNTIDQNTKPKKIVYRKHHDGHQQILQRNKQNNDQLEQNNGPTKEQMLKMMEILKQKQLEQNNTSNPIAQQKVPFVKNDSNDEDHHKQALPNDQDGQEDDDQDEEDDDLNDTEPAPTIEVYKSKKTKSVEEKSKDSAPLYNGKKGMESLQKIAQ